MFEKSGDDKTRYVHGSRAHHVRRVSSGWSQSLFAGYFPLTVHAMVMFSAGGGSLSLMLDAERAGFMRALESKDAAYDPAEKMLAGKFSSPSYHTTLTSGTVHRTCDSLRSVLSAGI